MLRALLSDVHGNIEALNAVLADIRQSGIDEIFCLGDSIGYGPNPVECLRMVRERCALQLMGNHEYAVITSAENFNPLARAAVDWTRSRIEEAPDARELYDRLLSLRPAKMIDGMLHVHGSVRDPLIDYVREPEDRGDFLRLVESLKKDFEDFRLCFVGHNHKAFLGTEEAVIYPHEGFRRFHVKGERLYICVGSVGQPRDGDPRACYVAFDGEFVEYRRVEYDAQAVADRILEAGLPDFLAARLLTGD